MKERFNNWRPETKSLALLLNANRILETFEEQGYKLTLRQLYYQLVAGGIIPNNLQSYNRIERIINRGRLAGYVDWSMIEDRTRVPRRNSHWESPQQIMQAAAKGFYRARWEDQDYYIEVWCEKDAVSNIIEPVCRKWDVLFLANRGYSSQTAMYDGYQRLLNGAQQEKMIHVIYLGDHDPSGIDMANDIRRRIGRFLYGESELFESVSRIALTMDQIKKYSPPENPAKVTDSRYAAYAAEYGESSWELDALEPSVLSALVEDEIVKYVDLAKFDAVARKEQKEQKAILKLADQLGDV